MTNIALFLLGSPRIERDRAAIHVDTRKAIAMLAYLAVHAGFQSRDTLAALLWSESNRTGARGALRRTISTLNTALGGIGLHIEREAIALDAQLVWCDLNHFLSLLRACESHGHSNQEVCPRCRTPLQEAINLYRGDFLQGFSLRDSADFELWQFQQSENLRRVYSIALEKLVHLYCEDGSLEQATHLAQRWLALDPLHESAHRHLMEIYAWSGQRSMALKQYQDCVRILDQELGVPPLEETSRLHQMIMDNDVHMRTITHDFHQIAPTPALSSVLVSTGRLPMVGRDAEVQRLDALYQGAITAQSHHQLAVIEGEAGIGKSRLTHDFLERIGTFNAQSFVVRSYDNESQTPYAALIRSLRSRLPGILAAGLLSDHQLSELARMLPDVLSLQPQLSTPISLEGVGAKNRLYEAVCQALLALVHGNKPGVLVFEDMQWLDDASTDLLAYLLRRTSDDRLMLILNWRSEEVPRTHPLRSLLTEYVRNGGIVEGINLARLDKSAVAALVASTGAFESAPFIEHLYHESEGLPLFINEYLVLLHSHPEALHADEWGLPVGIQSLVRSRLARVNETAQQILATAAVIGKSFDIDLLQECSGRNESETTDGIDELLRRGIFKEVDDRSPTYEFHHEKMRQVVYLDSSLARRRLLHKRTAQALLNRVRQTDKLPAISAQVAFHFQHSGQDRDAAEFLYLAGIHARSLYANHSALTHFEAALALGCENIAAVYQQIGDLNTLQGDYRAAIQRYQTGIAHATGAILPDIEHALGKVYHRLGEWEHAENYYQSAMQTLPDVAYAARSTVLTDWSLTKYGRSDVEQAEQLARAALAMAEQSHVDAAMTQAHNMLGILARKRGNYPEAYAHLEHSQRIAERMDEPGVHTAVLNNLALTYLETGDTAQAQKLLELALERCVQHGDRHHEAALRNNLADVFHAQDQHDLAMQQLKLAVTLFAQIGVSGDTMQSEIWRLAEW